jgi:thiamine kinase-like enzyme
MPLGGGITNASYRVELGGEAFVLRVGGSESRQLGVDRAREEAAARMAAGVGVGSEVVYADPAADILVTRFINGAGVSARAAREPRMLKRIAAAIRRIHDGPAIPGHFSPFQVVRAYHDRARHRGVAFPPAAGEALVLMAGVEEALGPPARPCPCHNDLLAANFIDDGQTIRIIDWEYAAMGDPYFDLGNFAVNQSLSQMGAKLLLEFYGGAVRPADLDRLHLMCLASDLREAFWGFLQSGLSALEFNFRAYGEKHLRRFLRRARTRRVERLLARGLPAAASGVRL